METSDESSATSLKTVAQRCLQDSPFTGAESLDDEASGSSLPKRSTDTADSVEYEADNSADSVFEEERSATDARTTLAEITNNIEKGLHTCTIQRSACHCTWDSCSAYIFSQTGHLIAARKV